jgi:alkanesulfonate monooxygenase SsuD/methylene tetrahydromethanopterin reductase-like flavin-dependent oxidoreductase (luciferase family)
VWDHVRWHEPVVAVADTQITLAAIARATEYIRLGPMVTPLARRRPVKVARETASLDLLSNGRLTLGVGLGDNEFGGEYTITGEELDDRRRARMLDEALEILQAARPATRASSRSTSTTRTSSPRSPRRSPSSPTTSSRRCRRGSTRRPTARPAPRGGWSGSRPSR